MINLVTVPTDAPAGSMNDDVHVSAEVRVRNLGLLTTSR